MDKQFKLIRLSIFTTLVLLSFVSCDKKKNYTRTSGDTMGTTYHITTEIEIEKEKIDSVLIDFSSVFSTYIESSFLSKFNEVKDTMSFFTLGPRHKHYETIFTKLELLYDQSNGAFNPYAAKLFDAWGFSEKAQIIIDDLSIDSLLEATRKEGIEFKNSKLRKTNAEAKLNLNAVAKGYGVDVVAAYLESQGSKDFLIEIGGELVAKGINPDGLPWRVGIRKPVKGSSGAERIAEVDLEDKAMATSGNYENFKKSGDSIIGHTIDPRTGYPSKSRVLSSTVFAKDCLTADALATACMVLGEGDAIKLIEETEGVDCYLIYIDNYSGKMRTYISTGMRAKLTEI